MDNLERNKLRNLIANKILNLKPRLGIDYEWLSIDMWWSALPSDDREYYASFFFEGCENTNSALIKYFYYRYFEEDLVRANIVKSNLSKHSRPYFIHQPDVLEVWYS